MSGRKGGPKTGGKNWLPGQSGNPNRIGNGEVKGVIKDLGRLNLKRALNLFNDICNMTLEELKAKITDPAATVIELMIMKVAAEAIRTGDYMRMNAIMDRLIGKITDKIEVKMPEPTVMKLRGQDAVLVIGQMRSDGDNE